jgi:hypothetical protein
MVGIFDPACELLSPWTKEIYLCAVAPLQYLLSDLLPPPPPPSPRKFTGGGGVFLFIPKYAGVLK